MKRPILIGALGVLGVLTFSACTPEEVALWQQWHAQDPTAAEAFAADYAAQQQAEAETSSGGESSGGESSRSESSGSDVDGGVWDRVAECESGGDWSIETGNGYSGGLQFAHSTWRAYGGEEFAPRASQASKGEQIIIAERVLDDAGWGAWPTCARRLGLR